MREFERRRKFQIVRVEEMKREQEIFVEKERKLKGCEENEEMKEMKRIRRKRNSWQLLGK